MHIDLIAQIPGALVGAAQHQLEFSVWAQMAEKWMTEKCARDFGGPDRGIYAASTFARRRTDAAGGLPDGEAA
jgi:hypothetical protein